MLQPTERKAMALMLATRTAYVTARQLAATCYVTLDLARRDLAALARAGKLKKQNWHGGTFYTRTVEERTDRCKGKK